MSVSSSVHDVLLPLPSVDDLDRMLAQKSLLEFQKQGWSYLEPGRRFVPGWHIEAMAEHLEAVARGQILRLIINIPPRHMKSLMASVFWPAWIWTWCPEMRFLTSSYAGQLSQRDAVKSRRLIVSPWYQHHWGSVFQLTSDQNVKTRYENDCTGYRLATSTGGAATGEGGDILLVDDPHKSDDAHSDHKRESDIEWWSETWSTRVNDPGSTREVIVMQRLHERDLTGHILSEVGDYEHLMLPARFESERRCTTCLGWSDPRKQDGDILWKERFTDEILKKVERKLGPYGTAGQLQQRPSPAGGGIFKAHWWRFWYPADGERPPREMVRLPDGSFHECEQIELPTEGLTGHTQSWDMAFKDTKSSAYVAGQLWAQKDADVFLLDQMHDKMDIVVSIEAVRLLSSRWPSSLRKLVEDKANGPAVIAMLKRELPGLQAVNPEGGKVARAHACIPAISSGNVYLPHPVLFPWVRDLLAETEEFPNGSYSDQVDALTQYLNWVYSSEEWAFV